MFNNKVNDEQYVPVNDAGQMPVPNNSAVIHQPPPAYAQINTQPMANHSQYQTGPAYAFQNGQNIPVVLAVGNRYVTPQQGRELANVHDYTVWSVLNFFCCIILAHGALHMSCKTKTEKRLGSLERARQASRSAAVLNTLATLLGIVIITLNILHYTGKIKLY